MLVTVVSSLISFERRRLIQIFPESVRKLWNEWELRATVLLSLFLQIVLIVLGSRRKYIAKNWIRIILWLAYLSADWIAILSLGVLSNSQGDEKNEYLDPTYVIMAFWAPFLLVHLGGPDTITAYAMEDNELWLRHLLSLIVHFLVAFYVFLRSFNVSQLNFVALPVFITGLIKYGERTWALRSASSEHFKNSMLPRPDPGPNYAKFMDEYSSNYSEGFKVMLGKIADEAPNHAAVYSSKVAKPRSSKIKEAASLNDAYSFFLNFRRLFADLILSFQDRENTQFFFHHHNMTSHKAFEIVEIELGFMYDVLYTKAAVVYTGKGIFLRSASLFSTIAALVAFSVINKHAYSTVDQIISYLLLVGAITLEMYAIIVLVSSDRATLWLSKYRSEWADLTYAVISYLASFSIFPSKHRWSNSMTRYNLITHCTNHKGEANRDSGCIHRFLDKYWYKNLETVPDELKEMVFRCLQNKSLESSRKKNYREISAWRGGQILKQMNSFKDELDWSVEAEFDQSILLWHIATDLCYYDDQKHSPQIVHKSECRLSKLLSDYMLYLLVKCPFMLPNGIGQIRFQDTYAEAVEFIKERKYIAHEYQACANLLVVETKVSPSSVKGDRSKSVLFDACILAKSLQSLEKQRAWDKDQKWDMISQVWVEMLSFAASQCSCNDHAKQLRRGGELLTHVWLLMVHLGITEHFQISQGHARVKLLLS